MGNLLAAYRRRNFLRHHTFAATTTATATRATIEPPRSVNNNMSSSSTQPPHISKKPSTKKKKYGFIPDNFSSVDQVITALRESGLESSNLIIGIDFTKSNEWTGKVSFDNQSLHAIGGIPNPYEKAISIIGKTLAPFDEDNLIPCFGFGDATTHDQEVFSFHSDHSPCHGFEEVLACYKKIVPNLQLSGPTSYGPVIDAAIDKVEQSGGQFHVLIIVADGQVTRSVNTNERELSLQEEKTIDAIVCASGRRSARSRIKSSIDGNEDDDDTTIRPSSSHRRLRRNQDQSRIRIFNVNIKFLLGFDIFSFRSMSNKTVSPSVTAALVFWWRFIRRKAFMCRR